MQSGLQGQRSRAKWWRAIAVDTAVRGQAERSDDCARTTGYPQLSIVDTSVIRVKIHNKYYLLKRHRSSTINRKAIDIQVGG